ncbi:MAG: class I SAM-dependent methyltransferase [Deltaproteobacteria bacterium]|nr:class I SAM-dependent methyltransferase [Deltaproteobacteria bacterium]
MRSGATGKKGSVEPVAVEVDAVQTGAVQTGGVQTGAIQKSTKRLEPAPLLSPGTPPSPIEPSQGAGASLKTHELAGKPSPRGRLTPREAARVAQQDYAAAKTGAYTADVNYKGGPDQVATAEYLALLDRPWQGRRVLDIGCGEGKLPNEYAPLKRARLVVGVDLSMPFLEQAVRERGENADYVRGDMNRLPVLDASMDSVISRFALHYTPNLEALFREIARVLKPGGDLTFVTNMIRGKDGAPVPEDVIREGWIPIELSERVTVNNLALTDQRYFAAMEAAGLEVEVERRFSANHKIGPSYAHQDEIELEAVIVRARKPESKG